MATFYSICAMKPSTAFRSPSALLLVKSPSWQHTRKPLSSTLILSPTSTESACERQLRPLDNREPQSADADDGATVRDLAERPLPPGRSRPPRCNVGKRRWRAVRGGSGSCRYPGTTGSAGYCSRPVVPIWQTRVPGCPVVIFNWWEFRACPDSVVPGKWECRCTISAPK